MLTEQNFAIVEIWDLSFVMAVSGTVFLMCLCRHHRRNGDGDFPVSSVFVFVHVLSP